ncbi:beta-ketoacyl reductase, partial [Myxococcota bacterium]|nr:beta-ketoacyl reductase [Myxococcota bacterium]
AEDDGGAATAGARLSAPIAPFVRRRCWLDAAPAPLRLWSVEGVPAPSTGAEVPLGEGWTLAGPDVKGRGAGLAAAGLRLTEGGAAARVLWLDGGPSAGRADALIRFAAATARAAREGGSPLTQLAVVAREDHPVAHAVAALTRALRHELRGVTVQLVLTDTDAPEALLGALRRGLPELQLRRGAALVRALRPTDLTGRGPIPGRVLITGGGSGIGAALAERLVARGCPRLVLVGRSPEPSRAELLTRLRRAGAEVVYLSVDVADAAALQRALDPVLSRWGGIDAVVHGAGSWAGRARSLASREPDAPLTLLGAKLDGGETLARRLPDARLIALGSVAALSGALGAGMADYAAANGALEGLARGGRWLTLHFGQWSVGLGAAAKGAPPAQARLGLGVLDTEAGLDLLERALRGDERGLLVAASATPELQPERLLEPPVDTPPPRPAPVAPPVTAPITPPRAVTPTTAAPSHRAAVEAQLCRLLKLSPAELDLDTPFADYGVDSLVLADLAAALEQEIGASLDPSELLHHPTPRRLITLLDARAPEPSAAPVAAPVVLPSTPAEEDGVVSLLRRLATGQVSEAEVARLLDRGEAPE